MIFSLFVEHISEVMNKGQEISSLTLSETCPKV